jgi:hypothetical protein
MTARHSLARLVYEDAEMNALGYTQPRVYAANSLDTPNPDEPFVVINEDLQQKAFGTTGVDTVSYWFHLPRGKTRDYNIINLAIEQLKMLMAEVVHLPGEDGWSLTAGTWVDTSRDLTDDVFNTIVKYVTFRVASRSFVTP